MCEKFPIYLSDFYQNKRINTIFYIIRLVYLIYWHLSKNWTVCVFSPNAALIFLSLEIRMWATIEGLIKFIWIFNYTSEPYTTRTMWILKCQFHCTFCLCFAPKLTKILKTKVINFFIQKQFLNFFPLKLCWFEENSIIDEKKIKIKFSQSPSTHISKRNEEQLFVCELLETRQWLLFTVDLNM